MYLSIVIPAYNEGDRLDKALSRIYDFLKQKDYDYEVIVVDDGSTDDTVSVALKSRIAKEEKLYVIKNWVNMGKGFSIKRGILATGAEFVLFSDADLSTPIEEADKLLEHIKTGFDIVIGSRGLKESDVRIHQPWYREKMGKVFNSFVKLFLIKEFFDTQCGFKLFKGSVARGIAGHLKLDGFCFDVEMLYLAKKRKCRIKEVGVVWEDSPKSKVRLMGSSFNMFLDIFRIRALHK